MSYLFVRYITIHTIIRQVLQTIFNKLTLSYLTCPIDVVNINVVSRVSSTQNRPRHFAYYSDNFIDSRTSTWVTSTHVRRHGIRLIIYVGEGFVHSRWAHTHCSFFCNLYPHFLLLCPVFTLLNLTAMHNFVTLLHCHFATFRGVMRYDGCDAMCKIWCEVW